MSEIAHIPQLRFPEFSGEWEEKRLGDIADFSKGKGISKSDIDNDGQLECIRYGELYTTYNELIKDVHSKTNIAKEDVKLSQIGDVIIPASGETAIDIATASCVLKDGVAIGGDLNIIRSDIDGVFNAYYLNNKNKYSVARLSQGSSVIHLYAKHLETLKLNLPTKPEQTKIAAFLTEVDTKIEQLSKKQELLGEYKKGLMQQIFSQVIRFKADDGSDFPDWEEKKLGGIGHTFNGLTGKTKDDFGRGKPYIQYMQIFESSKINIDNFGLVDVRDDENQKVAQYGDVFFTTSSETPDAVGYSSVLLDDIDKLYLNSFCFGFRPNSIDELSPNFAQFLLRSAHFRRRVVRLAQGSTRYNMSKVQLMKEVISLPCLKEQTKIANFLSSIDSKIEQVSKQLDESKQFKKALLQQMFV